MHSMKFATNFYVLLLCCTSLSLSQQTNVTTKAVKIPNFGILDIRVGKILDVENHPNADSLYVENVDIGELEPRTIVSSLVHHLKREELEDKLALFVVNFKAAKLRGVVSQGMIMCASEGEKVELLVPPEGSQPGDVALVEGYDYKPEPNMATKIYDKVVPFLRVDEDGVVTFNGVPLNINGKGVIRTKTIKNVGFETKTTRDSGKNCTNTVSPGPGGNITEQWSNATRTMARVS